MTVLFIQENPFLATAIELTMLAKGFNFIISAETAQPVATLNRINPAIIVVDISKQNGFEFITEAKTRNIPVIVISANGKEDDLQLAFDKGADDYLTMPVSMNELALRVSILTKLKLQCA